MEQYNDHPRTSPVRLSGADLRRIITESITDALKGMPNTGRDLVQAADMRGIDTRNGIRTPRINDKGEFLKAYKSGNGYTICIGGPHGTRQIPPKAWDEIGAYPAQDGLTFEEALKFVLKIGDYYGWF